MRYFYAYEKEVIEEEQKEKSQYESWLRAAKTT